jgi:tetratricopeptide (TPR) repeat protein
MNKTAVKAHNYELWYLVGATATAILLYTGLKWYQSQINYSPAPQPRSALAQQANQYYLHGNSFYKQGNYQEALSYYQQAIAIYPQHVQSHTMIGQCHFKQGKHQDAKLAYQNALKASPKNFEAHLALSQLFTQEMTSEGCAQAAYHAQQALAIQPHNIEAQFALGDAQLTAGNPREARSSYELINDPAQEYRKKLYIGQTYQREQNFEQAVTHYQQSIAANSTFPQSHIALAGAYFALGQLGKGFQEYEWRWEVSSGRDLQNRWAGQDLKNKTIVVLSENGLGDILQYVRFAQLTKQQGAHVRVVAPPPLLSILKNCPYIDELIVTGSPTSAFDYLTSMQSIPAILKINEHNLPNKPYIFADEKLVAEWKQKLAKDKNFKIGLCWQPGDDSYLAVDQKRGVSLEQLKPLAQNGISFYCLQMGGTTNEQLKAAPFTIHSFDETFDKEHGAFMDTAAVMKNMDLIITVDTSVGHLAGALGVPTWMLLSYASDVRWEVKSDRSIWYPSFTLFRQPKVGDWGSVIKDVSAQLVKKV